MGCCHPARRLKIKNVEMKCIGLVQGSSNGIHFDASRRCMETIITGTCGVPGCGKEITISTITYHETGDWSKVVYF